MDEMESRERRAPRGDEPADAQEGDPSNAPDAGGTIEDYFSFEEVFQRVLATADHELDATSKFLFWSGISAGFALGLTFVARLVFTIEGGETETGLIGNLFYPVGFVIIVIGRYQLFTENTLTPVVLVLTKLASLSNLLRLWVVVFCGNMIGAFAVALLLAKTDVLDPDQIRLALASAREAYDTPWSELMSKGLLAGWIVAAMVWLVHCSRDTVSKILVVWILMYFIGAAHFFHVITSSVEIFYLTLAGEVSFLAVWPNFVAPIFLGNTIGGVLFVAIINSIQFGEQQRSAAVERYGESLSWREWIFGRSRTFGTETARVE